MRRARVELAIVERLTGAPTQGCPWHAFSDPDVLNAIEAHHHWEKGQGREFWGEDPEWWLLLAVAHYDRVLEAIRADDARNSTPTAAGPPPGADVRGPEVSVRG